MNRILKIDPNIDITSERKVVDTRNYIIHSYDSLFTGYSLVDCNKSCALIGRRNKTTIPTINIKTIERSLFIYLQ